MPAGRCRMASGAGRRAHLTEGAMGKRPAYREIEHTADVGFVLTAPDLPVALERAAAAMFDLVSDVERVGDSFERRVVVRGTDLENLLVRWLTELLFIAESERVLLSRFTVRRLEGFELEADVAGEPLDRAKHEVRVEIKAATYHDIMIEETRSGWAVRVVFDT